MEKRNLTLKFDENKYSYIIKGEINGIHKVYLLESKIVTQLEIKRLLLINGVYPVSFTNIDEMILKSLESKPDMFFIGINNYEEMDYIEKIKKGESSLNDIFIVASGMLKNGEEIAYKKGAEIYFAKPLIWKILPFVIHTVVFINELKTYSQKKSFPQEIQLNFKSEGSTLMELKF